MKPRFQPETETSITADSAILIDPEAYDASEQQFAASLEPSGKRFVVDAGTKARNDTDPAGSVPHGTTGNFVTPSPTVVSAQQDAPAQAEDPDRSADCSAWRQEVAARLNRYRARRQPRQPRYPSLQLKFETTEPAWSRPSSTLPPAITGQAVGQQFLPAPIVAQLAAPRIFTENVDEAAVEIVSPPIAKIIEFPRATSPAPPLEELAEPVFTRPRILEAPEIVPPPPALGGITIEPAEEPRAEKRPGFEIPLQSSPRAQRIFAAAIDAAIVALALAGFAALFLKITASIPPLPQALGTGAFVAAIFWAIYQYLLLVASGATPGLKLARLRLSRFDGSPAPRSLRRWRVLASVLSAASLGLGYAWCFFDEDQLSWHDRITRTHMAPR